MHFAMPLRVRYVECDMQGRVFNGHYLTWVDMAHTEAVREVVGDYQALLAAGIDFVVAAAELQFRRPATFDDLLKVQVTFKPPGNTSLQSSFTILRDDPADPAIIAECLMTHVCVNTTNYAKQPWPEWIRRQLSAVTNGRR
jgi:acyl-CoA thioester hydrolase